MDSQQIHGHGVGEYPKFNHGAWRLGLRPRVPSQDVGRTENRGDIVKVQLT